MRIGEGNFLAQPNIFLQDFLKNSSYQQNCMEKFLAATAEANILKILNGSSKCLVETWLIIFRPNLSTFCRLHVSSSVSFSENTSRKEKNADRIWREPKLNSSLTRTLNHQQLLVGITSLSECFIPFFLWLNWFQESRYLCKPKMLC